MSFDAPPPTAYIEYLVGMDTQSPTAQLKQHVFQVMDTLEGWCSKEKASLLVDLVLRVKPTTIVEIGVFGGKSLVPMAIALKANQKGKIYGIDPWDPGASIEAVQNEDNKYYWTIVDYKGILNGLIQKIDHYALVEQIELIESTSENALPIEPIDILHVDGNHSEKTSYFDVTKWVPYVRKGGIIIFDDMRWHENGVDTTAKAVSWLDQHCRKLAEFTDACTWGIWIK